MKLKNRSNLLFVVFTALLFFSCAEADVSVIKDETDGSTDDVSIDTNDTEDDGTGTDDPNTDDGSSDDGTGDTNSGDTGSGSGPIECTVDNAATLCGQLPCVDGYCCDAVCDGTCAACNIPSFEGICTFILIDEDPDSECEQTAEADCGLSGVCDGAGSCAFYSTDVVCDDGKMCTMDDRCDGVGGCLGSAPTECAPGPANVCCEGACDDDDGCYTVTGACPEICEEDRLVTNQECMGCSAAGAEGICTGGLSTTCGINNLCQEMECNGVVYHCTNVDSNYAWRTSLFCDDGELCSFNDACVSDGVCAGTTYTCQSDYCMDRQCDGLGTCTELTQNEGNDCDTDQPIACPTDVCTGADASLSWSNYDDSCTKTCEAGTCVDCTCTPQNTSCTANGCCTAECANATGCFTSPGSCGIVADSCTADLLNILEVCNGCNNNDADGTCVGGGTYGCGAANACESMNCGNELYYCTNISGTWQWLTSDSCDDGNACTEDDLCGGLGTCAGTIKECGAGGCCEATCDTDFGCSTQATICEDVCGENDLFVEQTCNGCAVEGDIGTCDGTHHLCEDSDDLCKRSVCGGTQYYCTNVGGDYQWRTDNACTDNDLCTHGDYCDASTSQCIPVGDMTVACTSTDPCVVLSCNGTDTCSSSNTFELCDDSDPCTYNDICDGNGNCGSSGPITCNATSCNQLYCDGSSSCANNFVGAGEECGTGSCDSDVCTGTPGAETFQDYPASCDRGCDGTGTCLSCSCTATPVTCAVNGANECCESTCDSSTGCGSTPGSCADNCGTDTLILNRSCSGCGVGINGATGSCGGGTAITCNAGNEFNNETCGGQIYYCTDTSGSWQWDLAATCDDGNACTENDAIGAGGVCAGIPKTCGAGGCCDAACDTDSGCSTVATACSDQCGSTELIVSQSCIGCGVENGNGACSGTSHLCEDSGDLCQRASCDGTQYYCTNVGGIYQWRTDNECTDNNLCTYGDYCDASTSQCISLGDMTATCTNDDPCVELSCNGTDSCTSVDTFELCNDSDPCTFNDHCDRGSCVSMGPLDCAPTDCNNSSCNEESTCLDDFVDSGTSCGANSCDADECTGLPGSEIFHDYPSSCSGTCDGAGTCDGCTCTDTTEVCGVHASNVCCESTCDATTGCGATANDALCPNTCQEGNTLILGNSCGTCSGNNANGQCTGGTQYECSDASHLECQSLDCEGNTFYCTNASGSWRWEMEDPTCDDGNSATTGDVCLSDGTCAGTSAGGCPKSNSYTGTLPASEYGGFHEYPYDQECFGTAMTISLPAGTTSACVTFDSNSEFERKAGSSFYDSMLVYDGSCTSGTLLYKWAGKIGSDDWPDIDTDDYTIELNLANGGNICMCYESDDQYSYWGYAVTAVSY